MLGYYTWGGSLPLSTGTLLTGGAECTPVLANNPPPPPPPSAPPPPAPPPPPNAPLLLLLLLLLPPPPLTVLGRWVVRAPGKGVLVGC